jgi:hypothetical protein
MIILSIWLLFSVEVASYAKHHNRRTLTSFWGEHVWELSVI